MAATVDPLAEKLGHRPAWQVLGLGAGIVLLTLLAIVAAVEATALTDPYSPFDGQLHRGAVGVMVVLLLYETIRRISGAPPHWFLADRPSRTLFGWLLVGLTLPAAILGFQLWLLGARLLGGLPGLDAILTATVTSLVAGLFAGVLEELSIRGALLRVLEARWGSRTAIGATALVFALLHQGHATDPIELLLVLSSMTAAGLLLAIVVVRTRSVWNAVALHAGWNTVFGGSLVAAGSAPGGVGPAVLQYELPTAPIWLTGGGATLGATPLTTAGLLAAAVVVSSGPDRWLRPDGGYLPSWSRGER